MHMREIRDLVECLAGCIEHHSEYDFDARRQREWTVFDRDKAASIIDRVISEKFGPFIKALRETAVKPEHKEIIANYDFLFEEDRRQQAIEEEETRRLNEMREASYKRLCKAHEEYILKMLEKDNQNGNT